MWPSSGDFCDKILKIGASTHQLLAPRCVHILPLRVIEGKLTVVKIQKHDLYYRDQETEPINSLVQYKAEFVRTSPAVQGT
jgi:hypothetical protein